MARTPVKTKHFADNFAIVISDVLDTDVIIIDAKMKLIGSSFRYFSLYNSIDYGSLMASVLTNNKNLCVDNKSNIESCKICRQYKTCKMRGFVGVPIKHQNKVIGVLALILQKSKVTALFERLDSTIAFMESMAMLIAGHMLEHTQKKTLSTRVNQTESVLNAIQDAVIYTDIYGNIVFTNKAFDSLFQLSPVHNDLTNIKDLYPDAVYWLRKNKKLENIKVSTEYNNVHFYGTVSLIPIHLNESDRGFLCYFRQYHEIHDSSVLFSQGTLVTFSWLSKYVSANVIDKAKLLSEQSEHILIRGDDNAINELLAKAMFNYSDRRLQELKVIYIQNVYRDLLYKFWFDEYGVIRNMDKGTVIIVQPEKMTLYVQDKLAEYIRHRKLKVRNQWIETDVQFIFCTTENLLQLCSENLFSKDLYQLISNVQITNIDSLYNNYHIFEKFVQSGVKYYNKLYSRNNEQIVQEILDVMWENISLYDLGKIELLIEASIKTGSVSAIGQTTQGSEHSFKTSMQGLEKNELKKLLEKNTPKTEIAAILGISRSTLYRKIREYNFPL